MEWHARLSYDQGATHSGWEFVLKEETWKPRYDDGAVERPELVTACAPANVKVALLEDGTVQYHWTSLFCHLLEANEVRILVFDDLQNAVHSLLRYVFEPDVVRQDSHRWNTCFVDSIEVGHRQRVLGFFHARSSRVVIQ